MANELILLIFPVILFVLLIVGAKRPAEGERFFDAPFEMTTATAIKGFAAIGIILHHLTQKITEYGSIYKGPVTIFNWMGILFTAIFFFLSGYGLIVSKESKNGYIDSFIEKRLPSVVIPFYVSNIIYFIVIGIYFEKIDNALDAWLSLLGIRLINTNTWFIVEIIILYLVFYYACKKFSDTDKVTRVVLIASLIMIIGSLLLGHDYHDGRARNPFQGEWWYNTTILFYIGMKYAQHEKKIVEYAKSKFKLLMPLSVVLFAAFYSLSIFVTENIGYYQEYEGHAGNAEKMITLLAQVVACVIFVAMIGLIGMKFHFGNKIISFIGKISLELYIIHDMIKETIMEDGRDGNDIIFFISVIAISLVLAYLLNMFDGLLIRLWKGRKAYFADVPESYEGRQIYNRTKRIYNTVKISTYILFLIITVFAAIELYRRVVTPMTDYDDEIYKLSQAGVGDIVVFGSYETNHKNDVLEKLNWIVLDRQGDNLMLITENVIERYSLNQKYEDTNWLKSDTRELLNNDFYDYIFNEYEQKIILETDIESLCSDGKTVKTTDKIYFLSVEEAEKYFNDDSRKAVATSAAEENGVNISGPDKCTWWWLRDMTPTEKRAYVVSVKGTIREAGEDANVASGGIRPVIWVKVSNEE